MPFDPKAFGRRLKQARELRGLSQAELGQRMGGQTSSAVAQWETGASIPKTLNVMELPGLLSVSATWLFFGTGLPEQTGNASINPRLRGLGGVRVPKVRAQQAAADITQAAANANDFIIAPHADVELSDVAMEIWDDRNAPKFQRGDEVIIRSTVSPLPGDYVFVAIGPEREPEFGQLGRMDNGNWLLRHANDLWGSRPIRPEQDEIVAVCLRHISIVRQA